MIYDNGWYRIVGSTVTTHYFFNDKPIHKIKNSIKTDFSKRYANNYKHCVRCSLILSAYGHIGLVNRLK